MARSGIVDKGNNVLAVVASWQVAGGLEERGEHCGSKRISFLGKTECIECEIGLRYKVCLCWCGYFLPTA